MSPYDRLAAVGWDDSLTADFESYAAERMLPARVAIQHRNSYTVLTPAGEASAVVAGSMRHDARGPADLPAVGDWVALSPASGGPAVIGAVLPRRTALVRRAAGKRDDEQVIASNMDDVVVVSSLNEDYNVRRLERYVTAVWDSGATPVVALTKADLCKDPERFAAEVESIAPGVEVMTISAHLGTGLDGLFRLLSPGKTVVLVGSSGVGKSTLVNALADDLVLEVKDLRENGRGRHTTTFRRLVALPNGSVVVDTPGMRELQLWQGGVEDAFSDVADLARLCRFTDCAHGPEPGCAVKEAIRAGRMDAGRLRSYRKLQRELRFMQAKADRVARLEERAKLRRFAGRQRGLDAGERWRRQQ